MDDKNTDCGSAVSSGGERSSEFGKPLILLLCGSLVYYHCAFRNSSLVSLVSDVLIVLLCSLAILGLLFRQLNVSVPVDPLEWQISQDAANSIVACLANTVGAAESVLRVAATGHDKRLFLKVTVSLYILSALGRLASGVTVAYAALCLFCLYLLAANTTWMSERSSLPGRSIIARPSRIRCCSFMQHVYLHLRYSFVILEMHLQCYQMGKLMVTRSSKKLISLLSYPEENAQIR